MGIGLIAYIVYASSILVWCSLNDEWADVKLVSPSLLQQWLGSRSDLIVLDLQSEGTRPPTSAPGDFLSVMPSSLAALMDWIPPESTLVLCNRGVSSRAVRGINKRLALRCDIRVFWLDEQAQGKRDYLSSPNIATLRPPA
jgi:hypothetical protein